MDEALLRFSFERRDLAADGLVEIDGLLAVEDRQRWFVLCLPVQHQAVQSFPFQKPVPDLTSEAQRLFVMRRRLRVLCFCAKGIAQNKDRKGFGGSTSGLAIHYQSLLGILDRSIVITERIMFIC